ncbi:hypothetical protein TNCV_4890211 [Trichonephila clavipes]|nr:hypothetical protein TNCV_4890211 [Trichonephila clavipes]
MFLAGYPSQGCFGLQSHCAPCYFFNQASFYPSDFSFSKCCLHITHVLTYCNDNWTARLQALNAQDNILWAVQKFLKNKRSDIPPLNCSTGTAVTDNQKANILAESILDNITENSRPNNDFDDDDELINNTVNFFLSLPFPTTTETAYPSEIISYIKKSNSKKSARKLQRLARPISCLLHASMTQITVDPHLYSGYGMEARFASHMPSILTVVTVHAASSIFRSRLSSSSLLPAQRAEQFTAAPSF